MTGEETKKTRLNFSSTKNLVRALALVKKNSLSLSDGTKCKTTSSNRKTTIEEKVRSLSLSLCPSLVVVVVSRN